MNILIAGYDDTCKTLVGVAYYKYLSSTRQYNKRFANITINNVPDLEYLTTPEVKQRIKNIVPNEEKRSLYMIDEADIIFPADGYTEKEQKEAMSFASETHKLHTDLIFVMHRGKGVNQKLRYAIHRLIICGRTPDDIYYIRTYNLHRRGIRRPRQYLVKHPEYMFDQYDRWQVVKP